MPITLSGREIHNGFMLSDSFIHYGHLIILTGLNGSGKTRLLQSIQNNKSFVQLAGEKITNQEIILIEQKGLTPNFGGAYNDAQFQTKITSSLQLFDQIKNDLDKPFNQNHARNRSRMQEGGLSYEHLYQLCTSIAGYLNKSPSQLSHAEIKIHFEDHVSSVLGLQNVSGICNNYIKRKKLNRFNKFCSEHDGDEVAFLTDAEFLDRFGSEPWILLNKIIKATFDDKFSFTAPDVKSESYSYNAALIQKNTGTRVTVQTLSSGEKTLLWLALTLFNSQYYDKASVKTPKLLLLDEPDAFLHPKMVVKMYQALDAFATSFKARILITTHSPTTLALAPENSTYVVKDNSITAVTKDEGVAELLDGVTQIAISPENRRQVFVESQYDADVYQAIYAKLLSHSTLLDPKITLTFVSSGPKMPAQQLKDKAKQVLKILDEALIEEFVESINGVGNCSQVYGQVESLTQCGNKFVRGIVDRDKNNKPKENVTVLAENIAYSIENVVLDPICILLILHMEKPDSYKISDFCGEDVHWTEWLKNKKLLQLSVDKFIFSVLGKENEKNAIISYISSLEIKTDSDYLNHQGHQLERKIIKTYPSLKAFSKSGKDGELKSDIVRKSMINFTNGLFIPKVFECTLVKVQK